MSPNPINTRLTIGSSYDIQFDVKYKDIAKPSVDNKNACIKQFKPTVISNIEFPGAGQSELIKSEQSGDNEEGKKTPYYFTFNGYSCTDSGFVLKFTYVGLDAKNNQILVKPGVTFCNKAVISNLLNGAVFTGIVYMNPNGIDVNTPFTTGTPFVDHTKACT